MTSCRIVQCRERKREEKEEEEEEEEEEQEEQEEEEEEENFRISVRSIKFKYYSFLLLWGLRHFHFNT